MIDPKILILDNTPECHFRTLSGLLFQIYFRDGDFCFALAIKPDQLKKPPINYEDKYEFLKVFNYEKYILRHEIQEN